MPESRASIPESHRAREPSAPLGDARSAGALHRAARSGAPMPVPGALRPPRSWRSAAETSMSRDRCPHRPAREASLPHLIHLETNPRLFLLEKLDFVKEADHLFVRPEIRRFIAFHQLERPFPRRREKIVNLPFDRIHLELQPQ